MVDQKPPSSTLESVLFISQILIFLMTIKPPPKAATEAENITIQLLGFSIRMMVKPLLWWIIAALVLNQIHLELMFLGTGRTSTVNLQTIKLLRTSRRHLAVSNGSKIPIHDVGVQTQRSR
jgi:hypothetical protein